MLRFKSCICIFMYTHIWFAFVFPQSVESVYRFRLFRFPFINFVCSLDQSPSHCWYLERTQHTHTIRIQQYMPFFSIIDWSTFAQSANTHSEKQCLPITIRNGMPLTRIIVIEETNEWINENNLTTAYDYLKIFSEQHHNNNTTHEMHTTENGLQFQFEVKVKWK